MLDHERRPSAPLALAALLAASCDCYQPPVPVLHHVLSDATQESLAGEPAAQAQIAAQLDALFGTPAHPRFLLTADWVDAELDPNDGKRELSAARRAEIQADNEERYWKQLALIKEGRLAEVEPPREALDLVADWEQLVAELDELEEAAAADPAVQAELDAFVAKKKAETPDWFTSYYPSLRDSSEMYRTQCMHCHGVSGGGDGATSQYMIPRPRDYRRATFKWTPLGRDVRPRRQDLYHIIDNGLVGTAMPSFRRFSIAQIEGLTEYVRLLAIRGRAETLLALAWEDEGTLTQEAVMDAYLSEWEKWNRTSAEDVIVYDGAVPGSTPERVAHGRELYMDATGANCVSCHGDDGRGRGISAFEPNTTPEQGVWRRDDWGNANPPRDLTRGIYRGGSRPIDIYRRVWKGIDGTIMPEHWTLKNADGSPKLGPEDMWDIVFYVRSLSQPLAEAAGGGGRQGG